LYQCSTCGYIHGLHTQAKPIDQLIRLFIEQGFKLPVLITAEKMEKKRELKIMPVRIVDRGMEAGFLIVNFWWQIRSPEKHHPFRIFKDLSVIITKCIFPVDYLPVNGIVNS
jgi:hypothetical protein